MQGHSNFPVLFNTNNGVAKERLNNVFGPAKVKEKTGAMYRSVVFVKWERCVFWCIGILCNVTILE